MSDNLRNTLYQRPDIAAEVGYLIMYSANLEAFLVPMLMALLKCDIEEAGAITQEVDNISAKLAAVFKIAEHKPRAPKAKIILSHKTAILEAVALRNKLAHSLIGIDINDDMTMLTNATTSRRGPIKLETLNPAKIHKVTDGLRAALMDIEIKLGSPPSYGAMMRQAIASARTRAQASQKQGKPPKARKDP